MKRSNKPDRCLCLCLASQPRPWAFYSNVFSRHITENKAYSNITPTSEKGNFVVIWRIIWGMMGIKLIVMKERCQMNRDHGTSAWHPCLDFWSKSPWLIIWYLLSISHPGWISSLSLSVQIFPLSPSLQLQPTPPFTNSSSSSSSVTLQCLDCFGETLPSGSLPVMPEKPRQSPVMSWRWWSFVCLRHQ